MITIGLVLVIIGILIPPFGLTPMASTLEKL
jgi:hypothetical protein